MPRWKGSRDERCPVHFAPRRLRRRQGQRQPTPRPRASPPRAVKLLLPVWGYKFVSSSSSRACRRCWRPATCPPRRRRCRCEFIIMTSYEDAPLSAGHPAFRRLCQVCHDRDPVHRPPHHRHELFHHHHAGLHRRGARGRRRPSRTRASSSSCPTTSSPTGRSPTSSRACMNGASGVLVGNFQVDAEDALPWLQEQLNRIPALALLPPRELMRWGAVAPAPHGDRQHRQLPPQPQQSHQPAVLAGRRRHAASAAST